MPLAIKILGRSILGLPWFQRFIFIIFIAKWRGKINLWNQGKIALEKS
jgi:hypothetical protein